MTSRSGSYGLRSGVGNSGVVDALRWGGSVFGSPTTPLSNASTQEVPPLMFFFPSCGRQAMRRGARLRKVVTFCRLGRFASPPPVNRQAIRGPGIIISATGRVGSPGKGLPVHRRLRECIDNSIVAYDGCPRKTWRLSAGSEDLPRRTRRCCQGVLGATAARAQQRPRWRRRIDRRWR